MEKLEFTVPVSAHICTEVTFAPMVNALVPIEESPQGSAIDVNFVLRKDSIPIVVTEFPNEKFCKFTFESAWSPIARTPLPPVIVVIEEPAN